MRSVQNIICVAPTLQNFPNGRTKYIFAYRRWYFYSHTDENGNYCYRLIGVGARGRNRNTPDVSNRVCVGEINFVASNTCDIMAPESFGAAFVLNPFGELFVSNDPCAAGDHNYAEFLCSDSVSDIRTKLLAALEAQFAGKIDFDVTRNTGAGEGFDALVRTAVILPDGRILVVGAYTTYNGTSSERIIILNEDFTIDQVALGTGFDDQVAAVAVDGSGNIYAGGIFTSYNGTPSVGIIKLNPDLTINTVAIGSGFSAFSEVNAISIDANGDLIVGGTFTDYNGTGSNRIIKLNSDLTVDTVSVGTGLNGRVRKISITSNGDIVVGGDFTTYNGTSSERIIILNGDLTINTVAVGTGFSGNVTSLYIMSDGDILAGGAFIDYNGTSSVGLIRLNSDLTFDTAAIGTGFDSQIMAVSQDADGNILAGGGYSFYNGTSSNGIIKLNPDLTINTVSVGTGFAALQVHTIALQDDGKMVLGGNFTAYDGHRADDIIRLNSDLSIDTAFDDTYTIVVTFTDSSSNTEPTSLLGTILEDCVLINPPGDEDMNLVCTIN